MGRKPVGKEVRKRVNVMLEPTIHGYLKEAGDGNVSMGIHIVTMGWLAYRAHEKLKSMPKKAKKRAVNQTGGK